MDTESKLQNNHFIAGAIKEEFMVAVKLFDSDDSKSLQTEMASLYAILVEMNFPLDSADGSKGDEIIAQKHPDVLRLCNVVLKRLQAKDIIGKVDDKSEMAGVFLVSKYLDSVLLDYIHGLATKSSLKK